MVRVRPRTIDRRALISGQKSQPPLRRAAKYSGLLFLLGLYLSLIAPPPFEKKIAGHFGFLLFLTSTPGASWGWPSQARHKRPRSTPIATLVFSPVLLFFLNRQSRMFSRVFALRIFAFYRDSNPRCST